MKKNLWMMTALMMGMSAVCSCNDNDDEKQDNDPETQTTTPTFGGKMLTGMTTSANGDEEYAFSITADKGTLKTIDMNEIKYEVTHAPFTIKCDISDGDQSLQYQMKATFNDDGLISTFDSHREYTEPGYKSVEDCQAEAQYTANKQMDIYKVKYTCVINGKTDDQFDGTAQFTYDGDVLKQVVASTKGKEWDEEDSKLKDYTLTNTFECVYQKKVANIHGQYTNYDASYYDDDELATVMAMMGYMGRYSSIFPDAVNQHYVQKGGVEELDETDTITYDITLNDDGTVHSAFGCTYLYSTTRAQIATTRNIQKKASRTSIFRK